MTSATVKELAAFEELANKVFPDYQGFVPPPIEINKFKIGDEVEVAKPNSPCYGQTAKIIKILPDNGYYGGTRYQIEGDWVFKENELKKVSMVKFTSKLMDFGEENKNKVIISSETIGNPVGSDSTIKGHLQTYSLATEKTINQEEEKMENKTPVTQKIVDMWYDKKKAKIKEEIQKQKEEIIAADPVKQAFDAKVEELKKWYEEELVPDEKKRDHYESGLTFCVYGVNMVDAFSTGWRDKLFTDKTKEKLEGIEKKNEKLIALSDQKTEIETMLSGCTSAEEEWDILMVYGVVDSGKRLMA